MATRKRTVPANVRSGTLFTGDNLPILRGLNSDTIDLIYLDPPFNSNRTYSAPIGSKAAGAAFKDAWTLSDCDNAWHGEIADKEPATYSAIDTSEQAHSKSMKSYLIMMAIRLLEMRRILKPTGSLYLHCDPTASHYLKMLLDAIMGRKNFRNELVWYYSGGGASRKHWAKKHDVVLFYSKTDTWLFNIDAVRVPYKWQDGQLRADGSRRNYTSGKVPDDVFSLHSLMPWSRERTGYPTQKPLALLERIIQASSAEGDLILDPFCGCATALVAAEQLGRHWIGIDLSSKAAQLVKMRMEHETTLYEPFKLIHRHDLPIRTDYAGDMPNYRTHKHTLFGKQEGKCNGCYYVFPFRNFTVDHIIPQAHGGTDHTDNLQLLCGACNSVKGTSTQEQMRVRLAAHGQTKPRRSRNR